MSNRGYYGFDLDGTLALYDGWKGADHIGEPNLPILEFAKARIKEFGPDSVRIITARVNPDNPESDVSLNAIEQWVKKHIGVPLLIQHGKDYRLDRLVDDRALQIIPNSGEFVEDLLLTTEALVDVLTEKLINARERIAELEGRLTEAQMTITKLENAVVTKESRP